MTTSLPVTRLGRTDMLLTRVGFGAWAIGGGGWAFAWGNQDDTESIAAIRHAVESGVNWIGQRGQVISTYFVLCYCGLIISVIGVGVASEFIGDFPAVLALSILLAVLFLFSLTRIRNSR